jgi:predicted metal-dependent hydrolase
MAGKSVRGPKVARPARFVVAEVVVRVTAPLTWSEEEIDRWIKTKGRQLRSKLDVTAEEYREPEVEINVI